MVTLKQAKKITGLCGNTLRKYADNGTIKSIRTPASQRLFDIESFLKERNPISTICYCRVSSQKQKDDLERQVSRMQEQFPQAEIIKDIGSGLNFKRKGLKTILERLMQGDKFKIVVSHKDRLVRFGFDILQFLVEKNGGEILVLNQVLGESPETELTEDLLAILHHFSCRMHGMRSNIHKKNKVLSLERAEETIQELVGNISEDIQ